MTGNWVSFCRDRAVMGLLLRRCSGCKKFVEAVCRSGRASRLEERERDGL